MHWRPTRRSAQTLQRRRTRCSACVQCFYPLICFQRFTIDGSEGVSHTVFFQRAATCCAALLCVHTVEFCRAAAMFALTFARRVPLFATRRNASATAQPVRLNSNFSSPLAATTRAAALPATASTPTRASGVARLGERIAACRDARSLLQLFADARRTGTARLHADQLCAFLYQL